MLAVLSFVTHRLFPSSLPPLPFFFFKPPCLHLNFFPLKMNRVNVHARQLLVIVSRDHPECFVMNYERASVFMYILKKKNHIWAVRRADLSQLVDVTHTATLEYDSHISLCVCVWHFRWQALPNNTWRVFFFLLCFFCLLCLFSAQVQTWRRRLHTHAHTSSGT